MKQIGVIIGRFQPLHNGHMSIIMQAVRECDAIIVMLGSATAGPSSRNPFSFGTRVKVLQAAIQAAWDKKCKAQIAVAGINDHLYCEDLWIKEVKEAVDAGSQKLFKGKAKIVLYGSQKADTGYLGLDFGWKVKLVEQLGRVNATAIRKQLYENPPTHGRMDMPLETARVVDPLIYCREEYMEAQKYLKEWSGPFPFTFNTVDVMVTWRGHFLAIKRGQFPAYGLWAFPGGYINVGESLIESAMRELREETGLVVKPKDYVSSRVFDNPNRDPRGRVITTGFHFDISRYPLKPIVKGADDAMEAKWYIAQRIAETEFGVYDLERQRTACDFWDILEWFVLNDYPVRPMTGTRPEESLTKAKV